MYHGQSLQSKAYLWRRLGNELDPFSRGLTAKDLVMLRSLALTLTVHSLLAEENMAGRRGSRCEHLAKSLRWERD